MSVSTHLSVATAIEVNRIASDAAFVVLMEVVVNDAAGTYVETVRMAKNSENVTWQGHLYEASNFDLKLSVDAGADPKLTIQAQDPTGVIRNMMETYGGGIGMNATMTVVNTGNLSQPPEIQESFLIIEANASGYIVNFTLGIENPLNRRFPYHIQFRDQCTYPYKGLRCKYAGSMPTCDFTQFGANGCIAHGNEANFGGFPGLNNVNV